MEEVRQTIEPAVAKITPMERANRKAKIEDLKEKLRETKVRKQKEEAIHAQLELKAKHGRERCESLLLKREQLYSKAKKRKNDRK